jgi:dihydroneopterin aldolase / 2-amino-4-hydroxy-6-hydroxymethyldihydropteridine diphosphokinase
MKPVSPVGPGDRAAGDRITLRGLRARGRHGVLPAERADGQDFVADVVLWLDTRRAAAADDLSLTADYAVIAARLTEIISGEPVALIETLAQRLAAACLADDRVSQVEITVHKPDAPVGVPLDDVSVTILRDRRDRSRPVVLALGSNLGDRMANLQTGIDVLSSGQGIEPVAVSRVFETSPVGGPDQPDYLNAVLLAASALAAAAILDRCHAAEQAAGRARTVRWGPRTLDVDIIACGDEVSADPALTLPHPRAHERAFVLAPWHDVDPDARLPGHGRVADLLAGIGLDGVRVVPGHPLRMR